MGAVIGLLGGCATAGLACCAAFAGGALSTCCCKMAGSGRTDSTTASKFVMVWLQVFTTFLALVCAIQPWSWIGKLCDLPGFSDIGPCHCGYVMPNVTSSNCWEQQMTYRAESSGCCVFLFVLLLCVSGCSDTAAHGYVTAKFMMIPVLLIIFFFVPNSVFNVFGNVANILSSFYVIGQALLLVDFGYTMNEKLMSYNAAAYRRNMKETNTWKIVILVVSACLLVGSIIGSVFLIKDFPEGWWIVAVALGLSVLFGILSVSCSWCPHGNILTSCIVMAYGIWLSYEALLARPAGDEIISRPTFIKWIGLAIAAVSLFGTAFGNGFGLNDTTSEAMVAQARANIEAAEDGGSISTGEGGTVNKTDFILHSAIHVVCVLYVTTELAPFQSWVACTFRDLNVIGALLLFGFTLFAPKIFPDRTF